MERKGKKCRKGKKGERRAGWRESNVLLYPPPADRIKTPPPPTAGLSGSAGTKPSPHARTPRTVGVVGSGQQHEEGRQSLGQVAEVRQPLPVLSVILLRGDVAALSSRAGLLPISAGPGPAELQAPYPTRRNNPPWAVASHLHLPSLPSRL